MHPHPKMYVPAGIICQLRKSLYGLKLTLLRYRKEYHATGPVPPFLKLPEVLMRVK